MTYKLNNIEDNAEIILERQAESIRKLQRENSTLVDDLHDAHDRIIQLEAEKRDLTQALNNASKRINMRADQNWDGGFRAEVSE